jgi:chemotaxis protein MotB
MSRKKKHEEEHENHERWLVSYADFITLLFAFFTVLYATTMADKKTIESLLDGIKADFDQVPYGQMEMPTTGVTMSDMNPHELTMEESASPILRALQAQIAASLSDHKVQIGIVEQTLTVSLEEQLLFNPDSDQLHPAAFGALGDIADAVKGTGTEVWITGRAGSAVPSAESKYKDAFDLAGARANATVRYLESRGVPSKQLMSAAMTVANASATGDVLLEVHADDYGDAGKITDKLGGKMGPPLEKILPPGEGVGPTTRPLTTP